MFILRLAIGNSKGKRYLDHSAEFAEPSTLAFSFMMQAVSFSAEIAGTRTVAFFFLEVSDSVSAELLPFSSLR